MDSVLFCLQQIKSLSIHLFSPEAHRGLLFTQKHRGDGEGGGLGRIREISLFPKKHQSSVLFEAALSRCWMETEREQEVKTDSLRRGEEQLGR